MPKPTGNAIFAAGTFKHGLSMKRKSILFLSLPFLFAGQSIARTAPTDLPCLWTFDKAHRASAVESLANGAVPADGCPEAVLRYVGNTRPCIDKAHNPSVCGGRAGDYWLFTVPVDSLPAGERIGIDFLFGCDAGAAPYYRLEYFERGRWRPAGESHRCAAARGIRYTHRLFTSGAGNSYKVSGAFRLRRPLVHDTLRIRWIQAGDLRADGRPFRPDSIGRSGFCNAHGLGACIRRLGRATHGRPRRVLFIGNSYTYYNMVPGIVRELAASAGRELRVETFTIGGCTMERHLQTADCLDLIRRGGYDFAVFQDQSLHPALIGTPDDKGIVRHMRAAIDSVRKYSPHAVPLIEMTWGRRDGNAESRFDYDFLHAYDTMQERIRINVRSEAAACDADCAPVGEAWRRVRAERPELELYARDGSHPSYAGSYLAAAVICISITGEALGPTASDGLLDTRTAAYLRHVAAETVLGGGSR